MQKNVICTAIFMALIVCTLSGVCRMGYYTDSNGQCKSCPANCQICRVENSTLDCYACQQGYRVDIDSMKCVPCISNCAQCSRQDGRCEQCYDNYLYNFDADRCQTLQRDHNGVVECIKGYYNKNGMCLKCGAFCLECDDYGTCTKCEDKFYVGTYQAYYVSRVQCLSCELPCKTCSSKSECIEEYDTKDLYTNTSGRGKCDEGQFQSQNNGECVSCGNACTDCNKYGVCLECQSPYYLNDDKEDFPLPYCKPCQVGTQCAKDGSEDSQEKCGAGYFQSLTTEECIPCGYACKHCSRLGQCIQCAQGYTTNSEYFCITQEQQQKIKQNPCKQGFYQDPVTSICQQCKDNCSKCHGWNICDQCQSGFHLAGSDNTCYNETQYKQKQNTVQCMLHEYKLNNKCYPCQENCDVCNSDHCLACTRGFDLDYSSWTCKAQKQDNHNKCTNGCEQCSTIFACSKCKKGYYISGPLCYACKSQCPNCLSYQVCSPYEPTPQPLPQPIQNDDQKKTSCSTGQYLNTFNQCINCSSGCLQCLSESQCTICHSGFSLNLGKCYQQCQNNQYLNQNGLCSNCLSNCLSCSSSTNCLTCFNGYTLNYKGQCLPTSCPVGTFRNDKGNCQTCGPQCLECSDGDTCRTCASTYFPTDSGFCWKCGAQCRTCSSGGDCTHDGYNPNDGCPSGKFLNSYDQCYDCRYNCEQCADAFTCQSCSKGYYLSGDACLNCPYGCNQCGEGGICLDKKQEQTQQQVDYSTIVSPCGHGKYQGYMGYCYMCSYGCDYCDQQAKCHRCYSGYYMNYGFCNKCLYPCKTCSSMSQCLSYSFDEEGLQSNKIWLYIFLGILVAGLSIIGCMYLKKRNDQQSKTEKLLKQTTDLHSIERSQVNL